MLRSAQEETREEEAQADSHEVLLMDEPARGNLVIKVAIWVACGLIAVLCAGVIIGLTIP